MGVRMPMPDKTYEIGRDEARLARAKTDSKTGAETGAQTSA